MERRFIVAKAGTTLKEAMVAEDTDDLRAIIVEREGRIVGLIPPRWVCSSNLGITRTFWSNVSLRTAWSFVATLIF